MRLPLKYLHRAFPELDSYSDEQCLRFVRASRGSPIIRFLRAIAIGFVTLLATAGSLAGVLYVYITLIDRSRTLAPGSPLLTWFGLLLSIAIILIACATPPILGFLTRDLFLIRRVRHILRTRGVCISCRYTLVGLAVSAGLKVTCPECGTTTTVDPALGELVTDEAGRPRFKPDESRHMARRFFTEARIRRLKRAAPWIATVIIGGPLVLAGAYEIFLRWQAGVAQRERPDAALIVKLVESMQPAGTVPSDPDAWTLLLQAEANMAASDVAVWNAPGTKWNPNNERHYPEYWYIIEPPPPPRDEFDAMEIARAKHDATCEALAREMLDAHRQNGLYDVLRALCDAPRFERDFWSDESAPLFTSVVYGGSDRRRLSSICAARMRLAHEAGDQAEFHDALRSGLGVVSLQLRQPILFEYLMAVAQEGLILDRLRDEIMRGLPPAWLADAAQVLSAHAQTSTQTCWVEGERICAIDTVCWAFSEPGNVRMGRWSDAVQGFRANNGRLGTYRQNIEEVNRRYESLAKMQRLSVKDRSLMRQDWGDFALLGGDDGLSTSLTTLDAMSRLRTGGTRCMIALEQYRAANGDYPSTLDQLVPGFLEAVPIDPWTGGQLGYVRVDPATDPLRRAYLLYSTGIDFEDNRGHIFTELRNQILMLTLPVRPEMRGYDFIVNAPN